MSNLVRQIGNPLTRKVGGFSTPRAPQKRRSDSRRLICHASKRALSECGQCAIVCREGNEHKQKKYGAAGGSDRIASRGGGGGQAAPISICARPEPIDGGGALGAVSRTNLPPRLFQTYTVPARRLRGPERRRGGVSAGGRRSVGGTAQPAARRRPDKPSRLRRHLPPQSAGARRPRTCMAGGSRPAARRRLLGRAARTDRTAGGMGRGSPRVSNARDDRRSRS